MHQKQVVLLLLAWLSLTFQCLAFKYKPYFTPGPCANMQPASNVRQDQILHTWYATHYTHPSFDGAICTKIIISSVPEGVSSKITFKNMTRNRTPCTLSINLKQAATEIIGLYAYAITLPDNKDLLLTGITVYVPDSDFLLIWSCMNHYSEHDESAIIASKNIKGTPMKVVEKFKRYLAAFGSEIKDFEETPGCLQYIFPK